MLVSVARDDDCGGDPGVVVHTMPKSMSMSVSAYYVCPSHT